MTAHLLHFKEYSPQQASDLLKRAISMKQAPAANTELLAGKQIVAIFEKPSLRTRVSFDIGINKLGGHMVYVDSQGSELKEREDPKDVGANLSCWADAIVARVFSHATLEALRDGADIPVINALCDRFHPCQALADYITMHETLGDVQGRHMAYVGDGNNVTHSLLILGILLGCNQTVITPEGHGIDPDIQAWCEQAARQHGVSLLVGNSPSQLKNVDVLYTDTWLSMGDDTPLADIKATFAPYQVNADMMAYSGAQYAMHCQPAHRDLEITAAVMDSQASLLMQQAENRMHAQNAILAQLLA